jgi:hypothetical protein
MLIKGRDLKRFFIIFISVCWVISMNFIFFKYTGITTEVIAGEGVSKFKLSYFLTVILPPMVLIIFHFETKS